MVSAAGHTCVCNHIKITCMWKWMHSFTFLWLSCSSCGCLVARGGLVISWLCVYIIPYKAACAISRSSLLCVETRLEWARVCSTRDWAEGLFVQAHTKHSSLLCQNAHTHVQVRVFGRCMNDLCMLLSCEWIKWINKVVLCSCVHSIHNEIFHELLSFSVSLILFTFL